MFASIFNNSYFLHFAKLHVKEFIRCARRIIHIPKIVPIVSLTAKTQQDGIYTFIFCYTCHLQVVFVF